MHAFVIYNNLCIMAAAGFELGSSASESTTPPINYPGLNRFSDFFFQIADTDIRASPHTLSTYNITWCTLQNAEPVSQTLF